MIFQDIKTAVKLTAEVRKERKAGAAGVQLRKVYKIPCVTPDPAYYNTIEGSLLWECGVEADKAVRDVFRTLPYDVKRKLEFSPAGAGKWVERARFWQETLKPALPPKMYGAVITKIIGWYAHCLRARGAVK